MLGDVNARIKDGGLGIVAKTGDGIHLKIGAGTKNLNKILTITASMDTETIKEKLGDTSLYNAVIDSLSLGCQLLHVLPISGGTPGKIGTQKKEWTGQGTVSVQGTPTNDGEVTFRILDGGGFNEATYIFSLDGDNYTKKATVPTGGAIDLGIGVSIHLTEHSVKSDSFKSGDKITFKCAAPKLTNQDVLNALNIVKTGSVDFEYIHIVGESKKALWAALSVEAKDFFETYKRPMFFLLEAAEMTDEQNTDEYVQALIAERKDINSFHLQIAPSRIEFTAKDGAIRNTPLANLICGLYARAKVHESIGMVEKYVLDGVLSILPEGIENYTPLLDESGYTTVRQYIGLEGFYITNARSMSSEVSDYKWMENVRTIFKAIKAVRKQSLQRMHMSIDPSEMKVEMLALEKVLEIPLDAMKVAGEISSGKVSIDPDQNVLALSELQAKVHIVPKGTLRSIDLEFGLRNPYLQRR